MRRRLAIAIVIAAASGACAVAACSSTKQAGFDGPDSGGDDATVEAARAEDAQNDSVAAEAAPPADGGGPEVKAGCSPINSDCDLVLQNCGPNEQCIEAPLFDGGIGTACFPVSAAQHLPKGHSCCPNPTNGRDQCGAGLRCIGLPDDPCAADASLTGRCTPSCCDDDICGKSEPEGFAGRCTLNIVDDQNQPLYKVCDYNPPCKPFHVQACPSGFTCIVEDRYGTAGCVPIYNSGDGGSTSTGLGEGERCDSLNSCADGLLCVGPSGDARCTWLCLTPGSNPPFDAGALRDASAGYGGCPVGEHCMLAFDPSAIPPWISACSK